MDWFKRNIGVMLTILIAVALVAGLYGAIHNGLGGTDTTAQLTPATTQPVSECKPLKKSQLKAIAEGLRSKRYQLTKGATLPLPKDSQAYGMRKIAAVRMVGRGHIENKVAVLAMGKNVGPITVVSDVSRVYFDWGTFARKGSPMRDYQNELLTSDAARDVPDCL
jgi:hypothetical protein